MGFNKKLEEILGTRQSTNAFSGTVLIKRKNEELFKGCYGYANRAFKVPNAMNTKFRIASISKMFTAVIVLKLIEESKLSFNTSIKEYLDLQNYEIPEEVDIHSLLTHTSGIGDYFDEENDDWDAMWLSSPIYNMRKHSDYYSIFSKKASAFKTGEKYKYNNAGYILLGMAIEKASGQSYFDYVKKELFAKQGMKDSDFISLDMVYENIAEGYIPIKTKDGEITGWQRNIYKITPEAAADGGATSTAEDLIRFLQQLKSGAILSEAMTSKVFEPQVLDQGANGARGYVWKQGYANCFILDQNEKIVRGGHTGEEYGFSCRLYYYPEKDIDVAILANQDWCAGALGWEIHDAIMELL
ncbi:MAG: beta-lactamase [Clostridiales bacterium]|nr:beta-lactamase [Clostridiales bacterium]